MKKLILLTLLILIVACSASDDKQPSSENVKPDPKPNTNPPVISTKLLTIEYPSNADNNMAYYRDKVTYTYNNEKISKINSGGNNYSVNYINNDLIELNLLEENKFSNDIQIKESIHLDNNIVQYILTNTTVTYSPSSITKQKDSISYLYNSNFISKIEYYRKASSTSPYHLTTTIEYKISNGNIASAKEIYEQSGTITSNYTYDNKPKIKYGDFAYETPLIDGFTNILIIGKLGTQNSNNVTSVTNTVESTLGINNYYKTINYTRKIDSNNRLQEISMTGTTVQSTASSSDVKEFSDAKIKFTY